MNFGGSAFILYVLLQQKSATPIFAQVILTPVDNERRCLYRIDPVQ